MPQAKPGIATTILAPDAVGEGFVEISPNKTLFVQKLTQEDAIKPQVVEDLQKTEDVFAHFKPSVDVEMEKEDGSTFEENFAFNGVGDFDAKNLVQQSEFLQSLNLDNDAYLKIIKQLKTNKSLKNALENPDSKLALVNALKALLAEVESAED